jgi:Zn-dependent alcohol dehydrogenase
VRGKSRWNTLSSSLGTGWFAADAANVHRGRPLWSAATARWVCFGVLSAKQTGAERMIAMSRHGKRQQIAREFGATDIVSERGDDGVARTAPNSGVGRFVDALDGCIQSGVILLVRLLK